MLTVKSVEATVPKVCSVVRPRFWTAMPTVAGVLPSTSPMPVTVAVHGSAGSTVMTAPSMFSESTARVSEPNSPVGAPPSTSEGCTWRSPTLHVLLTQATWKFVIAIVAPVARSRTIAPSVPTKT